MPRKTPSKKKAAAAGRKKKRTESFSMYIYKVLKQVHPDTGTLPPTPFPWPAPRQRADRTACCSSQVSPRRPCRS